MKQPIDIVVTGAGPGTPGFTAANSTSSQSLAVAGVGSSITPSAESSPTASPSATAARPTSTPAATATSTAVPRVRDLAVTRVSAPSLIVQGSSAVVTVDVENRGTGPETFTVGVTSTSGPRTVMVGTQELTGLGAGQRATLTFELRTSTQDPPGQYIVKAAASELAGEADLTNNRGFAPLQIAVKT
jgi:hypothetical protein